MSSDRIRDGLVLGAAVIIVFLFFLYGLPAHTLTSCTTIGQQVPVDGSQGYRVWSGQSLISFDPPKGRVCVPDGWEALGASDSGPGWATFPTERTGVLIHTADFDSTELSIATTAYAVRMVYPVSASSAQIEAYSAIVTNAFGRAGTLFGDSSQSKKRMHTVLVTAGLAGDTIADNTRVYPDPGPDVTMLVRTPGQQRSQELFIHAVLHVYNRERPDLDAYENAQPPLAKTDWQELEAAWAELAFTQSDAGRLIRLHYMYTVHTAVQTNNFSLIKIPPFDDKAGFEKLIKTAIVPETATYLDEQYGHYILAPIVMDAIDGLLERSNAHTDVEELLTKLHTGAITNFFAEVQQLVGKDAAAQVQDWLTGKRIVPEDLVYIGANHYVIKNKSN